MSYSAFFTSGLRMASPSHGESFVEAAEPPPPPTSSTPHITVQPSTPRPRLRRRRSSLTIGASPMSAVKSPLRSATEAARTAMRGSTHIGGMSFLEGLPVAVRPKVGRRKTISHIQDLLPAFPAPTAPLPPLPSLLTNLSPNHTPSPTPSMPIEEPDRPLPVAVDPVLPSVSFGTLQSNPARRSSSALPPPAGGIARGPLTSSVVGNIEKSLSGDMQMLLEEKEKDVTAMDTTSPTEMEDDSMKEN